MANGNTVFYQEVREKPSKITWRQILSNAKRKHTREELDYAMTAGMGFNTATEEDMLKKWHKPWLFLNVLKVGLILIAIVLACYLLLAVTGLIVPAVMLVAFVVPPLVVPITVMIFVWELNIPKNISIVQLFGTFIIGGVLSIVISMFFFIPLGASADFAPMAAFAEEPGKFLAAFICLLFFQKKRGTKMYAVTAATIGAAVGSGFSAFETAQYVFNTTMETGALLSGLGVFFMRALFSVGSHTLFCAIPIVAFALGSKGTLTVSKKNFANFLFWIALACSMALHFLWNFQGYVAGGILFIGTSVGLIVLQWVAFLWVMKKALYQVISVGRYESGSAVGYMPEGEIFGNTPASAAAPAASAYVAPKAQLLGITAVAGSLQGQKWSMNQDSVAVVGRTADCGIQFPANTSGVSRQHCKMYQSNGYWVIQDMNSSFGTFVNGEKLLPGLEHPLNDGDQVNMGGNEQVFRITFE